MCYPLHIAGPRCITVVWRGRFSLSGRLTGIGIGSVRRHISSEHNSAMQTWGQSLSRTDLRGEHKPAATRAKQLNSLLSAVIPVRQERRMGAGRRLAML